MSETRRMGDNSQKALSAPDGTLQPGQVLQNRYRVLGIIGMGGMGAVYQARDLRFEATRLCAIKEMINMAKEQKLREAMMEQFQREANILATLDHPAIPKIYDFFGFGDRAYLVLEYIQGKDLEALMGSTEGLMPVDKVRRWGIEICDVLDYLHNHQPDPIIFRDMKPSNIMIDQHDRVRLIDFGIAKTFQTGQAGTMIGTEGYSPPEQYKGIATPAADVYALGASLHHLLTNRDPRMEPPFSFDQVRIQDLNTEVSDAFAGVVNRALSYAPQDRYASAEAMKQSLEAAGGGGDAASLSPQTAEGAAPSSDLVPGSESAQQPQPPMPQGGYMPQPYQGPPGGIQAYPQPGYYGQQMPPQQALLKDSVASVRPIWSFKVEDSVRSSAAIHEGVLYIGSYDNNLWALNARDGELLWKFPTDAGIGSSPVYNGGIVYVGSADNRLYAVDARSGKPRWNFRTEGKIFTTPHVAMGMVFLGSDDGSLYALKPSTSSARETWKYPAGSPIRSSPIVVEEYEVVIFGNDGGDLIGLGLAGELRWRYTTRRKIMSSPAYYGEKVYVGGNDWNLYAIEAEKGYLSWRFRAKGAIVSTPEIADGKVLFGSADGNLYAVDASTGREIWSVDVGSPITSSPCANEHNVYVSAHDGNLYAFHLKSGDLLWRFQSGGPMLSSPRIPGPEHDDQLRNMVFVGSDDRNVYALNV